MSLQKISKVVAQVEVELDDEVRAWFPVLEGTIRGREFRALEFAAEANIARDHQRAVEEQAVIFCSTEMGRLAGCSVTTWGQYGKRGQKHKPGCDVCSNSNCATGIEWHRLHTTKEYWTIQETAQEFVKAQVVSMLVALRSWHDVREALEDKIPDLTKILAMCSRLFEDQRRRK